MGFLMLFCIWDRNITHKKRLGILIGVALQLLSGFYNEYDKMHNQSIQASESSTSNSGNSVIDPSLGQTNQQTFPVQ